MKKTGILLFALSLTMVSEAQTLTVNAQNEVARVSPLIYGSGAEDVNHEIYGGLYDQRIFGESFEEDAVSQMEGWRQYDNAWSVTDDVLQVITDGHGKIVYEDMTLGKGSCEVEVRLDGQRPIAGFIVDVSDAGNGADRFNGYEVALDCDDRTFVFGKHQQNWQAIANFGVSFDPKAWNKLRVDFDGAHFVVSLNGTQIYTYDDPNDPLMQGHIGLRSFDGSASFRNLRINNEPIAFKALATGVSSMWTPVGDGQYEHDATTAFNGTYSQKIVGGSGVGVANMGLNRWGIGLTAGKEMTGCVYLKGTCGKAYVALQSADGSKEYARQELTSVGNDWQRFAISLTPNTTDAKARFVILMGGEGTLWADQAMLYTDSYPYRQDITDAFIAQGLTFLRYGGCMVNAKDFMVKDQMGPAELRPPYEGWWYKNSSNGFGIIEFVKFARMINAEPCFGVNIEDSPTDVLALLKELEPYNIRYLEIGNEENIGTDARSAYEHYVSRFLAFYEAIHPVYPDIQFISAAWWRGDNASLMEYTFKALDGKCALWDYHPWTETFGQARDAEKEVAKMQQMFLGWNPNTTMRCAILEENGNIHNHQRAIAHAVMLNVVRRTNGFVVLDSPANALQPYMQNDNGWDQGQIFFNTEKTWGQPPYYVQQMASRHHQPIVVETSLQSSSYDVTATRNEAGDTLVIHLVNLSSRTRNVTLDLQGFGKVKAIHATTLAGAMNDRNLPDAPEFIVPQEEDLDPTSTTISSTAYSYMVLQLVADNSDRVENVTADSASDQAQVFDLQGRRVENPHNGVFIANNKKMIYR